MTTQTAKKSPARALTSFELCAGGGGSSLGLEQAGFSPVALYDNDPHACATLRHNRPNWNVVEADIQWLDSPYRSGVDLLSGGLPCPPFSIAGKQLGRDDDRDLFPAMLRIVPLVRPRAVLIENVRGILAPRFTPFRERVNAALNAEGFDTHWALLDSSDFGVPQKRSRAFLVALLRDATNPLRWPTPAQEDRPTVATAIGDLMAECGWRGAPAWMKQADRLAPTIVGGSLKHGGPDLGPSRARREWAKLGVDGLGLAKKIRQFLLQNIGRVVDSTELRAAADGAVQYARRLRELRDEEGWPILSHNDSADLKPGQYLLREQPPSDPSPVFMRGLSARMRASVLDRNGFTCQMCGITPGEVDPSTGRNTRLHIGHIIDKSHGGKDELSNLRALCSTCNQGAKNVTAEKPSTIWLLTQIRRAGQDEQRSVYEWLQSKFGA